MRGTEVKRGRRTADVVLIGAWLAGSAACGPEILESGGSSDTGTGGTMAPPAATVTTSPPPPPPPDATTIGPLDTGEFDTGAPWLDLPEDCSSIEQDCPPGYKCMPYANDGSNTWNDRTCMPVVDDPQGVGEPCTVQGSAVSGLDDCDATSMCWNVLPETNEGVCAAFCVAPEEDPGCAEPCQTCIISVEGLLPLCFLSCDPVAQDCSDGQACYPWLDAFGCIPDASGRQGGIGEPCEFTNGCSVGTICVDQAQVPDCGGFGCCVPTCSVGGEDPCPSLLPGTECVPWFEDEPPIPLSCFMTEPGACLAP